MQEHMALLESSREGKDALLIGLDYLLNISFVADDEVFKICLDYWNFFVPEVYSSVQTSIVEMNGGFGGFGGPPNGADNSRKRFFSQVLSRLRLLMITRMAKPEEVSPPPPPTSS
jgi:exportin-1